MPGFVPGSTRDRGDRVEDDVVEQLQQRGLELVCRNVVVAGAEVDLIARQPGVPDTYVFIEVRSRNAEHYGSPLETVDGRKRARIVRAATAWLVAQELWERVEVRFDVVGVITGTTPRQLTWIEGAFEVDG